MNDWDIHGYEKWLTAQKKALQNWDIPEENKRYLLEFDDANVLEGLGLPRRTKLMFHVSVIARDHLAVPFSSATIDDLRSVVTRIESNRAWSAYTKRDYKIALRKLFKWVVYREDGLRKQHYPPIVSWVRIGVRRNEVRRLDRSAVLTTNEVQRMIDAEPNPRNKALIATIYELGARIGEVGHLRVRNVQRDDYSLMIDLDGKTGKRTPRLVLYASQVVAWLNLHPQKDDLDAALWPNLRGPRRLLPLRYQELVCIIKRAAKKAGLKKRVWAHLLRHSRVTHLVGSGILNNEQAKVYFGWSPTSRILESVYSHLITDDANDTLLNTYGIKKERTDANVEIRHCGMCDVPNAPGSQFCYRCGHALSLTAVRDAQKRTANAGDLVSQFLERPEVKEMFKKMILEELETPTERAEHPRRDPRP